MISILVPVPLYGICYRHHLRYPEGTHIQPPSPPIPLDLAHYEHVQKSSGEVYSRSCPWPEHIANCICSVPKGMPGGWSNDQGKQPMSTPPPPIPPSLQALPIMSMSKNRMGRSTVGSALCPLPAHIAICTETIDGNLGGAITGFGSPTTLACSWILIQYRLLSIDHADPRSKASAVMMKDLAVSHLR